MHSNDSASSGPHDPAALTSPIPPDRMLVPYERMQKERLRTGSASANACFLTSLIASGMNAETVRSRRKAPASLAAARYRAIQALTAA